jgi:lysozyme
MKITKTGEKGLALIKSFEGFVGNPYKDSVGIPTIGYGATFYPDGKKVTLTDTPINESQATDLLKVMISQFEQYVDSFCVDSINQNQFDALVSFCYNLGPASLKSSTLLKKVNINPNDPTIRGEFGKWVMAGGKALPGLVRRRAAEADLYFTPVS